MDTSPHETIGRLKNQLKEKDKDINALKEQVRWRYDNPENNNPVTIYYDNIGQYDYGCAFFHEGKYYWNGSDSEVHHKVICWLPIPELNK